MLVCARTFCSLTGEEREVSPRGHAARMGRQLVQQVQRPEIWWNQGGEGWKDTEQDVPCVMSTEELEREEQPRRGRMPGRDVLADSLRDTSRAQTLVCQPSAGAGWCWLPARAGGVEG